MPKDCIILVADLDAENAIKGLLTRPAAMDCRTFSFDLFRHPRRDPGVRLESGAFISPFRTSYDHAILILDRHGSGADPKDPEDIERDIENALPMDWRERTVAIVIDPEVEAWVWSDSPEVDRILGWQSRTRTLREWLVNNNLLSSATAKPADPKAAYERALFEVGKTRSASIFMTLGQTVSTRRCSDRAFVKLRTTLRTWFPHQP
jgi:hypothetical protein